MKKLTLALSALTLAIGLSACGGGTSSYVIGGVVVGLEFPGLVLSNNGENLTLGPNGYTDIKDKDGKVIGRMPNDVNYSFKNQVDYGDPYNVTVTTSPPHQICRVGDGTSNIAGRLSMINAVISCSLVSNPISGKIFGMAEGLELTNGSNGGKIVVTKDMTSFEFPEVTYGQSYGVTVLKNPTGQICTVKNGAGEMGDDPVTNIEVTCVAQG